MASNSSCSPVMSHKRREMDVMKLVMSDYDVEMEGDGYEFLVQFHGPKGTLYEGGVWQVSVTLPKDYPYQSPSIGFKNRMYHPNVDEISGSVCLDVINQTWSPMYELVNIFDMFLPQLLSYPNADDPLNGEAAALLLGDKEKYKSKVKDYVQKFAQSLRSVPVNGNSKKTRNQSTDSAATASSVGTVHSEASSSTYASMSTSAPTAPSPMSVDGSMQQRLAQEMRTGKMTPSPVIMKSNSTNNVDVDDDLSSLSGGSDAEDDLVLDL